MIIMEWGDVHPEPHGSIRFSVPDLEKVSLMVDRSGSYFDINNYISVHCFQMKTIYIFQIHNPPLKKRK